MFVVKPRCKITNDDLKSIEINELNIFLADV